MNILLVLDRSGSISPFRNTYRDAAKAFVNALDGTPTQIGIVSFSVAANSYQDGSGSSSLTQSPLDLSDSGSAGDLNDTIEDVYANPSGGTNWDRALQKASQAKGFSADAATGQTTNPDVVVFITDGNPTARSTDGTDSGSDVDLIDLTAGMASANLVKSKQARALTKLKMYALGVGAGVTAENLKAVSGPLLGEDYETPTVAQLTAKLTELAARTCGARVFVRKRLAGSGADQEDWGFTGTSNGGSISYLDGNRRTHHTSGGRVETGVILTQLPAGGRELTVTEDSTGQPLSAFQLDSVSCRTGGYDGAPVTPVATPALGVKLSVQRGSTYYCTFVNSPAKPKLKITKTPDSKTINAGEDAEFTITVTNEGAGVAKGVKLTDDLPDQGTWTISSNPGGCQIAAGMLTCDFGDLPAGESRTVKVKTTTSFQQCATYVNGASVASDTEGTKSDNGNMITCKKPNLTVSKTPDGGTVDAGADAVFTIVVSNTGDGVAKNVTLSDQLPAPGVGGWTVSQQPSQGSCAVNGSNLLTCTGLGDLAKGESRTVKVKTGTSNDACPTFENPAATASAGNHPDVSDGGSIDCRKDAKITVVKQLAPTTDGGRFALKVGTTVVAANAGDGGEGSAFVDPGTHSVSEAGAGGTDLADYASSIACVKNGQPAGSGSGTSRNVTVGHDDVVVCTITNTRLGKIEIEKQTVPGGDATAFGFTSGLSPQTFQLSDDGVRTFTRVQPNAGGAAYEVSEDAAPGYRLESIDCGQDGDSAGSVQTRTASIHVSPGETVRCKFTNAKLDGKIVVVKDGPAKAHHGDSLTYTFDVSNAGNSPLHDVVVTDDRCAPVTRVSGDALLEPGEHWTYTCTYTPPAHDLEEEDPIVNTVTATAKDEQDKPVSDTDDHTTDLLHPDIEIDKQVDKQTAHVGDTLNYTFVVTNEGDTPLAVEFSDPRCDAGTLSRPDRRRRRGRQARRLGDVDVQVLARGDATSDPNPLPNTAKVTGTDELGGKDTDEDIESVDDHQAEHAGGEGGQPVRLSGRHGDVHVRGHEQRQHAADRRGGQRRPLRAGDARERRRRARSGRDVELHVLEADPGGPQDRRREPDPQRRDRDRQGSARQDGDERPTTTSCTCCTRPSTSRRPARRPRSRATRCSTR